MSGVIPLSPDGAASDCTGLMSQAGDARLRDMTAVARFGLKGPQADAWFGARGVLPKVNEWAQIDGGRLLRLGARDIMVLADADTDAAVCDLRSDWEAAPQGYSSWREETWAWLRLDGPAAMAVAARLTAFDLRATSFGRNAITQTRFAHLDAVLLRAGDGLDILFDIAATARVVHDIHDAIARQGVFG